MEAGEIPFKAAFSWSTSRRTQHQGRVEHDHEGHAGPGSPDRTNSHHVIEAIGGPLADAVLDEIPDEISADEILDACNVCEELAERKLQVSHHEMRKGDHIWWVTDNRRFESDYPGWKIKHPLDAIFRDIYENGRLQWKS